MDNNNFDLQEQPTEKQARLVKLKSVVAFGLVICFVFGLVLFILSSNGYIRLGRANSTPQSAIADTNNRFTEVWALLEGQYIGKLDTEVMTAEALKAYVHALGDPYTEYMEKPKAEGFINGDYGKKSGIGVKIFESTQPEGIYIKYVFPSSPAEKAGLLSNDIITAVNGTVVTHENYGTAIDMIAGEAGTTVSLTVQRGDEVKDFAVVRGSYTVSPIEYRLLEGENGIAYIRIDGVSSNSASLLKTAIETLKKQGAAAYIFDVRDDGGGYLNEVTSMLDMLLPEGPIVRYTHKGEAQERVNNSDAAVIVEAPMAVLINGNTASAAELFAAALSDYKLATLVGEKTFGKGVIQTLYPLKNGDYLKITTGEYFPPFSDNFHGVGVKPDISVSLPDGKYYHQLSEKNDTQLQAAINALEEKLSAN